MNAFHVLGSLLACWALLVSFLGITRENFPADKRSERVVIAISATLVAAAIGSGIVTAALEAKKEHEKPHKGGGEAALVVPLGR